MDGSDILTTAADGLKVYQDTTGLPHNDGLMPYSVQLQAGHTAADLRGFVVVQITAQGNGPFVVKVSDIGEGIARTLISFSPMFHGNLDNLPRERNG